MTGPPPRAEGLPRTRCQQAGWAALAVGALATGAVAAWWAGFYVVHTGFDFLDDEGYVIMSLRSYARGGRLYEEVYSQYGPVFYQLMRVAFDALGLPYTPAGGRAMTLGWWIAAAVLCGLATFWITRRVILALCVEVLAFWTLTQSQFSHPGGFVTVVLSLLVAVAAMPGGGWRPLRMAVLGGLAVAAVFIKVNVGLFAVAALGFVLAGGVASRAGRRIAWLVRVAAMALPVALMATSLDHPRVTILAGGLVFAIAALALADVAAPAVRSWRDLRWVAAAGVVVAGVAVAVEVLRGTAPAALFDGMVLRATNLPRVFLHPPLLPLLAVPWGATMLVACALVHRYAATVDAARFRQGLALARIVAGVAMLWAGASPGRALSMSPPLVWLAIAFPSERTGHALFGRRVLAAVALLQVLHVFPVAGAQVIWGTVLLLPLGAVCLHDGVLELAGVGTPAGQRWRAVLQWMPRLLPACVLATVLWSVYPLASSVPAVYAARVPLGLPGAEGIRVPRGVDIHMRLTMYALRGCTTFVSIPGMGSFYFFSQREPPTMLNAGAWTILLTDAEQERIVAALRQAPMPCVVHAPRLEAAWSGRTKMDGPLLRYITADFRPLRPDEAALPPGVEVLVPRP